MTCEDTISRQAAIKSIEEKAKGIKNEDTLNGLAGAIAILFDLPSTKPQERTGHWIFKHFDEDTGISNSYWCSECNTPLTSVYKNFCPNCGAKMRTESEEKNG